MVRIPPILYVLAALVGLNACGQGDPFVAEPEEEGAVCTLEGTQRLLPLAEGNAWTMRVTDLRNGRIEDKTQTVGALEDMEGAKAGVQAFRVTRFKSDGETISWQEDDGTSVVHHAEQDRAGMTFRDHSYEDFKTRFDEADDRLVEGATWTETFTEESTDLGTDLTTTTVKTYEWTVARMGEEVTVPAGSFCTVQVTRATVTGGTLSNHKQYWYARGVGEVKERSGNQREELVEFVVN